MVAKTVAVTTRGLGVTIDAVEEEEVVEEAVDTTTATTEMAVDMVTREVVYCLGCINYPMDG